MFPRSALTQVLHCGPTEAVFGRYGFDESAGCTPCKNFGRKLFGDLGIMVIRSTLDQFRMLAVEVVIALSKRAIARSAFGLAVGHVIFLCAREKMGRVRARWIVASVANQQPERDGSVGYLVRDAMGRVHRRLFVGNLFPKSPVSRRCEASPPAPAFIWATPNNARPVSFNQFGG